MINYKYVLVLTVVVCSGLIAKDLKLNDVEEIERFYFNKGFKQGYDKAYKEGYVNAYYDFRKKLRKYKQGLKAVEAGKYLYREGRLKYPEVYRIQKRDGSYVVKIVPPKIVGELTIKELGKIPEKYISDGVIDDFDWETIDTANENENIGYSTQGGTIVKKKESSWTDEIINSFRSVGSDRPEEPLFEKGKNIQNKVVVMFDKNEDLEDALNKANLPFVKKSDGSLVVKFKDNDEYKGFCVNNFGGECPR